MGWFAYIVVGLVAGALGKLIMPGRDPGGIIVTMLIGIAGAMVGGFIGRSVLGVTTSGINIPTILIATGGSVLLLFLYRMFKKRSV